MIIGQSVSSRPKPLNSLNSGMRMTCGGKNMPGDDDKKQRVAATERQFGEDIAGEHAERDRTRPWPER